MRYRVDGVKPLGMGDGEYATSVYVDAADRDEAMKRVRAKFQRVTRLEEARDDEGRGWLWRLWRWVLRR